MEEYYPEYNETLLTDSGLHMIIMDELDAICKQRGSTNTGTGVHDTVVNQLLSKIDGVEQLNNILIIGMTNRYTERSISHRRIVKFTASQ